MVPWRVRVFECVLLVPIFCSRQQGGHFPILDPEIIHTWCMDGMVLYWTPRVITSWAPWLLAVYIYIGDEILPMLHGDFHKP